MKNLKKIVFGLLAMLVMVTGVRAAECYLPGEEEDGVACAAKVNGVGFADLGQAWLEASLKGGELVTYVDSPIAGAGVYAKNLTIDLNGNELQMTTAGSFSVSEGATLTIKNGDIVVDSAITPTTQLFTVAAGGKLVLSKVNVTVAAEYNQNSLVVNNGTLEISSDVYVVAPAASVVAVPSANSKTTLGGEYEVQKILGTITPGKIDKRNPASTVEVKGEYLTSAEALTLSGGIIVTVDADITVEVASASLSSTWAAVARVTEAELVVKGGNLTTNANQVIVVAGTTDATKLTIEGGIIKATRPTTYALQFRNPNAVYAISGGTFESAKDVKAAIGLDGDFTEENEEGETHVVAALKGILTGGKYLNKIIARTVNAAGGTVDVSEELVAEGYVVKTEDPYKLVVKAVEDPAGDEPSTDEPVVDPSGDGEPAGDETEGKVPSTFDGIASIVTMAISSVSAAGYSIKKIIRK